VVSKVRTSFKFGTGSLLTRWSSCAEEVPVPRLRPSVIVRVSFLSPSQMLSHGALPLHLFQLSRHVDWARLYRQSVHEVLIAMSSTDGYALCSGPSHGHCHRHGSLSVTVLMSLSTEPQSESVMVNLSTRLVLSRSSFISARARPGALQVPASEAAQAAANAAGGPLSHGPRPSPGSSGLEQWSLFLWPVTFCW
jgi:hypothetical protein